MRYTLSPTLWKSPWATSLTSQVLVLLLLGMAAYAAGEAVECSGVLSLFVCSVCMQHYTYHNLSSLAQASATVVLQTLSSAAEASLAILVGVALVDYTHCGSFCFDTPFLIAALPTTVVARAAAIFPLAMLVNVCCRRQGRRPRPPGSKCR